MKSWLIKLGKAWGVFRNEGIISVFAKIKFSLIGILKKVGSGDVLFVTSGGGAGASAHYRCHNQMEELELHGFRCATADQDSPFLESYVDKFKVFIILRPAYNAKLKRFVEKIKQQNKEIIFETDDLLFDPQYLSGSEYLKSISALEKPLYEKGVGSEILADSYVKTAVVSTSYLAQKIKDKGKNVFVSTNKLSNGEMALAEKILSQKKEEQEEIKMGYFSGTTGHDKDFAEISEALFKILESYPNVRLFVFGPLVLDEKLESFKDRVVKMPFVSREKHFKNISLVDVNLAPLEVGNPFCEAKSELKFFEAGIFKVPTVASATQTFREAISDSENGFVAINQDEWVDKLGQLVKNKDLRKKMGEKARETTLQKYTNQNSHNEDYYNYLKSKLV